MDPSSPIYINVYFMGWILWKSFLNKNIVCGRRLALRSNMLPDKKLSTGLNLFSSEYRWIGVVGRICCSMYLIFEIRTKYSILSLFFHKTSTVGLLQATHLITSCVQTVCQKKITSFFSIPYKSTTKLLLHILSFYL